MTDQASQIRALIHDLTGERIDVAFEREVGQYGAWLGGCSEGELIGSGDCESEALEDALRTVRMWESK
jgi:hypothetical protein